jgi:hypothetical protein
MIREFMIPLVTLCCMTIGGIASLDKLCQFHQMYQSISAKLQSERWLLEQCADPHFFTRMHTHTDLCFQVENNARVGAFMLTLRELTQSFLLQPSFLAPVLSSLHHSVFSWPALGVLAAVLLLAPSWLVSRSFGGVFLGQQALSRQASLSFPQTVSGKHWPECSDGHFKSA